VSAEESLTLIACLFVQERDSSLAQNDPAGEFLDSHITSNQADSHEQGSEERGVQHRGLCVCRSQEASEVAKEVAVTGLAETAKGAEVGERVKTPWPSKRFWQADNFLAHETETLQSAWR
jgi:hypothetical protein